MREFCNVKRSAVADSRFVPNRSLRIWLLECCVPSNMPSVRPLAAACHVSLELDA